MKKDWELFCMSVVCWRSLIHLFSGPGNDAKVRFIDSPGSALGQGVTMFGKLVDKNERASQDTRF